MPEQPIATSTAMHKLTGSACSVVRLPFSTAVEICTTAMTATRRVVRKLKIAMASIVLWVLLILPPTVIPEKVVSFLSAAASVALRSLSSSRGTELYRKSSTQTTYPKLLSNLSLSITITTMTTMATMTTMTKMNTMTTVTRMHTNTTMTFCLCSLKSMNIERIGLMKSYLDKVHSWRWKTE